MTKIKIWSKELLKTVKNLKSLKMLIILVSWINCFECLFKCSAKRFLLTEKVFLYNIEWEYMKKGTKKIFYI